MHDSVHQVKEFSSWQAAFVEVWLADGLACNTRELKGVLNCALLCRVHAANLQQELVIKIMSYTARNGVHVTHAKQLEPCRDHFDAPVAESEDLRRCEDDDCEDDDVMVVPLQERGGCGR